METGRGRQSDDREVLRRGDETPSTSTPQSTTGRLDNAPSILTEPSEIQKAFARHVRNASTADFAARRRHFLKREREAAQLDYEKIKKTSSKFPIVADQALQKRTKIEAEYDSAKQEETGARATEQVSAGDFMRLLLEIVEKKDEKTEEQNNALVGRINTLEKELHQVRLQQARPSTHSEPPTEEVKKRIQKLEDFRLQQLSENAAVKGLGNKSKDFERRLEGFHADLTKTQESSRKQRDDLRDQQRAIDKDVSVAAVQAIEALKLEVEALRQRIESLDQRVAPFEAQVQDSQNLRTAEKEVKEQIQQLKETARAHQQAADNTERLRKSIHLKVENLQGAFRDDISTVKSDVGSLHTQFSDLSENVTNLKLHNQSKGPKYAALESEIISLKQVDQDQSERVAALDASLEELSEEIRLLQSTLGRLATAQRQVDNSDVSERLSLLQTQINDFATSRRPPEMEAIMEELRHTRGQVTTCFNDLKRYEEKFSKELESFQRQVTALRPPQRVVDTPELSSKWEAFQTQVAEHVASFTHREEKISEDMESIKTEHARSKDQFNADLGQLQLEFTNYTELWKKSESSRDKTLIDAVKQVQDEQTYLKDTLVTLGASSGLASEQREQNSEVARVASSIREVATQVDGLQRALEKQMHVTMGLNQRFNNLTTESLARQMVGVANKAIPKFEKVLRKVEGQVQDLQQKMETFASELGGMKSDLESKHDALVKRHDSLVETNDTLTKNFEKGRDEIVNQIRELENTRDSTQKDLKALETKLENTNFEIEKTKHSSQESTRDRYHLGTEEPLINSNGQQGTPQRETESLPVVARSRTSSQHADARGQRVTMAINDSDEEEDDEVREAMLESFKKPPLPPSSRNSSREAPQRTPKSSGSSSKRKRSESRSERDELAGESDNPARPPNRKGRRENFHDN